MAEPVTTIQVGGATLALLERWGARSHRGGGDFSRNVVLLRSLQALRGLVDFSDPRETAGLPEAMHRAGVELLEAPWTLKALEVNQLGEIVRRSPGLGTAARAAEVEPQELVARIAALSFAEKMAIVYCAIREQAPVPAVTPRKTKTRSKRR
ncbi:MAG TPA: hypothetical protein VHR45_20000 [Thermoanaerobaculia bacterium]|nr:hypothetical protein [Thermoanaerobaculia bacterium]